MKLTISKSAPIVFAAIVFFVIGFALGFFDHRHDFEQGVRFGLIAQMDDPSDTDIPSITEKAKKWRDLVNRYAVKETSKP